MDPTTLIRRSRHRAPPLCLPEDAAEAAALVLSFVQTGDTAFERSAAIEAMADRVQRLADPGAAPETVVAELAGHAALLDALFQRWTCEAMQASLPENKVKFAKLALASQTAYTRTLIAIEGLKQQAKGKARVIVEDEIPDVDGG